MSSLPRYTFVPWLRQGLAAKITDVDGLGSGAAPVATGRPTLSIELKLGVTAAPGSATPPSPSVKRDVQILGPGDVAGLKAEAILRTYPVPGSLQAGPDELAFVEFYDEDLPWRYTPASASASRLRPWMALLVLRPGEFRVTDRGGKLAVLTLEDSAPLPPADEAWAWAHAQISTPVADVAAVGKAITDAPDQARSRLLSPRRLEASTDYHAFLVPAFETGRLAGLDRPSAAAPRQLPSWGQPIHAQDRDLPIYSQFAFRTSSDGDFETLAMKLAPKVAGETFGRRFMDVSDPGFGLEKRDGATVELEGALAPPTFSHAAFTKPWDAIARDVRDTLDAGVAAITPPVSTTVPTTPAASAEVIEPVVTPPSFGLRHKGQSSVGPLERRTTDDLNWIAELNLDLRSRAAAGLGAEFVRQHQDELMQRAWEQVAGVEAANQRLREAELARATSEALMRKHLEPLAGDDRLTMLTAQAQPGLPSTTSPATSLRSAVDASALPAAAQSPAFRRLVRPQRPLMKRLKSAGNQAAFQGDLLTEMDGPPATALTTAPAVVDPKAGVKLAEVQGAVTVAFQTLNNKPVQPAAAFLELTDTVVQGWAGQPNTNFGAVPPAALSTALTDAVRAKWPASVFPPDATTPDLHRRVWALATLVATLPQTALTSDAPGRARIEIPEAEFEAEFSDDAAGKSYGRVIVVRAAPVAGQTIGRSTALSDVKAFGEALDAFNTKIGGLFQPTVPSAIDTAAVRSHVLDAMRPKVTLHARLSASISSLPPSAALGPVQAHPVYPDPLFNALRALGQDYVIPNIADLPRDSITVMKPNRRFIESYLAGVNVSMNQELLWREYPTDQRGTPFKVFWDKTDAPAASPAPDIKAIDEWGGALGSQSSDTSAVLVLVVRGALLERFPTTVVTAQRAAFASTGRDAARVIASGAAAEVRYPIFSGRLDPDIRLFGFQLDVEDAKGRRTAEAPPGTRQADPGWFFVFMERPGEPRFGLDPAGPAAPITTWNDLSWPLLATPTGSPFVHIAGNAALTPTATGTPQWGRTSADQASILLQSPVILARHASEMLP